MVLGIVMVGVAVGCSASPDSASAPSSSVEIPASTTSIDAPAATTTTQPPASCDEFAYRDDAEWSLAHDFYRYAALVEGEGTSICAHLPYVNPPTTTTVARPSSGGSSGSGTAPTRGETIAEGRARIYGPNGENLPKPERPTVTYTSPTAPDAP